jgi:hypothetical protein
MNNSANIEFIDDDITKLFSYVKFGLHDSDFTVRVADTES